MRGRIVRGEDGSQSNKSERYFREGGSKYRTCLRERRSCLLLQMGHTFRLPKAELLFALPIVSELGNFHRYAALAYRSYLMPLTGARPARDYIVMAVSSATSVRDNDVSPPQRQRLPRALALRLTLDKYTASSSFRHVSRLQFLATSTPASVLAGNDVRPPSSIES